MPQTGNLLTLIIHTKNEEKNIVDCIKSAGNVADEILVADMGSTDKTVDLANKLGARVIKVKDAGFADPARNYAMSEAKGKWIFSLDADERLTPQLQKTIRNIITEDKYDVVNFPMKNIMFNKWIEHTGWWPDYHIRLFKKGHIKYHQNLAHFPPEYKGKKLDLGAVEENAIIHDHIRTIDQFVEKMMRHSGRDDFFLKNKMTADNVLNYINGQFKWRYIDQKGYLDGTHGYVLSKLMEFYWFLNFAKHWQSENFPDSFNSKEPLDIVLVKSKKTRLEKLLSFVRRKVKGSLAL